MSSCSSPEPCQTSLLKLALRLSSRMIYGSAVLEQDRFGTKKAHCSHTGRPTHSFSRGKTANGMSVAPVARTAQSRSTSRLHVINRLMAGPYIPDCRKVHRFLLNGKRHLWLSSVVRWLRRNSRSCSGIVCTVLTPPSSWRVEPEA